MAVLALDLGLKTGYAVWQESKLVTSGTKRFKKYSHANFFYWLQEIIKQYGVDTITYERVRRHLGTDAAHAYGGYMHILRVVAQINDADITEYGVSEIKKFIAGDGRASKDEVIYAVQCVGYRPIDSNESDAIAVLLLYLARNSNNLQIGTTLTKWNAEARTPASS